MRTDPPLCISGKSKKCARGAQISARTFAAGALRPGMKTVDERGAEKLKTSKSDGLGCSQFAVRVFEICSSVFVVFSFFYVDWRSWLVVKSSEFFLVMLA